MWDASNQEFGDSAPTQGEAVQLLGQLYIYQEKAILINNRRKLYWEGDFSGLIKKLWDLDMTYLKFKNLVLEGIIPENNMSLQDLSIAILSKHKNGNPLRIEIVRRAVTIKLKIYSRKKGRGRINFTPPLKEMVLATIDEILGTNR